MAPSAQKADARRLTEARLRRASCSIRGLERKTGVSPAVFPHVAMAISGRYSSAGYGPDAEFIDLNLLEHLFDKRLAACV